MSAPDLPRPLRLPLASGATTLVMLFWGTSFLLGTLFALALVLPLWLSDAAPSEHRLLMPLVPILFFVASIFFHHRALRARASDLVLDGEGLVIDGGPGDGRRFAWAQLDLARSRIETDRGEMVQMGQGTVYRQRLHLALQDGRSTEIASSLDLIEQASFAACLGTLRALTAAPAPSPPTPADARVLACPACAAPVQPADTEAVTCRHCAAAVAMPDEVRTRLREGLAALAQKGHLTVEVDRLLTQPSAGLLNRWIAASLAVKYSLPVTLVLLLRQWIFVLAVVWLVGQALRARLAARHVYQHLVVAFAARPRRTPGEPLTCRRCAGPLPDSDGVLRRCAYCAAENLVAPAAGGGTDGSLDEALDVAALVALRRHQRRRFTLRLALGLAVAAYGLLRPHLG